MNKVTSLVNSFAVKVDNAFSKKSRNVLGMVSVLLMVLFVAGTFVPMFCANEFADVFNSILGIIFTVARYIGIVLAVWGAIQYLLSMKDDNADGQSRAIRLIIVGIALFAAKSLFTVLLNKLGANPSEPTGV